MLKAYSAARLFTGREWLEDHAVIVKEGVIRELMPVTRLASDMVHESLGDQVLVPGFIDVQVYGAGNRLFSQYTAPDTLFLMEEIFRREGTVLFQPTLATNTAAVFRQAIDALRAYWLAGGKGVHGLHLEGPWLHPDKRGAHLKEWIHSPTLEEVRELLDYGGETITMITVAPEVCPPEVISLIQSYGIILSAGHSNASFQQATDAFNNGVEAVTHLYNAMSPLHHREPGLAGAAMLHPAVRASVIPDGHHVDFNAIRIAKALMGERLFAITDAVTNTSEGPYQHYLAGDKYEAGGILSGSALSMYGCFRNLMNKVGIPPEEALRMCSLYPAEVLGVDQQYGRIAPLQQAQMILLDSNWNFVQSLNLMDEGTGYR